MGKALHKLLRLDEAVELMAREIDVELGVESLNLLASLARISSRDVTAELELPFFDRSAVDGYAVRAEDTFSASDSNPVELRVVGEARFDSSSAVVGPGEAVKVFTGSRMPKGADAVVMLEDVVDEGDKILVVRGVAKYANVALRGEDIRKGMVLVRRGTLLRPKHLAALAALGISKVEVYEKIKFGIICTGDEIVEPGELGIDEVQARGLTYNSTGVLLMSVIASLGFAEPVYLGRAGDSPREIAELLREALSSCHVVVTTGGVGPSERDVTLEALEQVGGTIVVRGLAIRPGRPTSGGIVEGKPIFMLSGYPVAAFVGLRFFAFPVLEKALKIEFPRTKVVAKLIRRTSNAAGYTTFVRVKLCKQRGVLCAEPLAATGSGTISTILEGDGVVAIPPYVEGYEEGELVEVELF